MPKRGPYGPYQRRRPFSLAEGMIQQVVNDRILLVGFPDFPGGGRIVMISAFGLQLEADAFTLNEFEALLAESARRRQKSADMDAALETLPIT